MGGTAAAAELLVNFVHQKMEVAPAAVRWQEVDRWRGDVGVSIPIGGVWSEKAYVLYCIPITIHTTHTTPYTPYTLYHTIYS
jgi:hypothetical protein